jgi:MFS family permease
VKRGLRSRGPTVLGAAFLGNLVGVGLTLHVFGVFVQPVAEGLGATMAVMGLAPLLWQCVNGLLNPLLGRVLGPIPIRTVMAVGALLLGTGLVLLSRAETLLQAGLVYGFLVSIGSVMVGTLPAMTLVSNWFEARRGRALGIVSAGTTGSGLILPPLAAWLIGLYGWRQALLLLGIGAALIAIPVLLAFVIDRPEQVGEAPDGRTPSSGEGAADSIAETPPVDTREVIADRNFWLIGLAFGLIFAAGLVPVLFTVPYAMQLGLTLQDSAWVMSLRAIAAVVGRIALTGLSDHVGRRAVLWALLAVQLVLWNVLVGTQSTTVFVVASVSIGFMSASFALKAALVSASFGRESFSRAMGLLYVVELPFQLLAAPVAGYLYDTTGDYAVAFRSFMPAFVIAGLILFFVRDGPVHRESD